MNIFSLPLDEFKKEVDKFLEGISPEELLNELEKYGLKIKEGKYMREIKFRGKSDDEWVYGYLLRTEENDYGEHGNEHFNYLIQTDEVGQYNEYNQYYITDNETIGQYTGLKDKNGVEIYEGDIVYCQTKFGKAKAIIEFINGKFVACWNSAITHPKNGHLIACYDINKRFEVIGNIYDDPELLKESD